MSGFHGLFIPGPTNMPFLVRQAMDVPLEDQRAPDFPAFTLPLFRDLKKVFRTEKGQVLVFPSSGTGGWEAAMTNTLSPGDKVLIAVFGQFSHLWADLARRHGFNVDVIDVEWGEGVPLDLVEARLSADRRHEIKAVLVCHNETATGVTSDVAGVRRALDAAGHPALLMVDGVSSIASIDFRMDEWGVDLAVSGSQKGFMLPTGLAIVAASQKALAAHKTAKCPRCFFDFADMIRANKDGFFPYTPATTLLRGLRASLDMLLAEGLDNVYARHRRLAEGARLGVGGLGAQDLRQGAQVVLRHGDGGVRAGRLQQRRRGEDRLLPLPHVAGRRPLQGGGQGVPHRPYRQRQRDHDPAGAGRLRDGTARCRRAGGGRIGCRGGRGALPRYRAEAGAGPGAQGRLRREAKLESGGAHADLHLRCRRREAA